MRWPCSAREVGDPGLRARAGVVTGSGGSDGERGGGVGSRGSGEHGVAGAVGRATPGAVLVDEVTRQVSSAAIVFEDAGEHPVKGKAEPLRLWRAVRVVAGSGAERAERVGGSVLGRDERVAVGEGSVSPDGRAPARLGWLSSPESPESERPGCVASSRITRMGSRTDICGIWVAAWRMGTGSPSGRCRRWCASGSGSRRTHRAP